MAECMAEVEEGALAGLTLVAGDDCSLGAASHRHRLFARGVSGRAFGKNFAPVRFQPREEYCVAEQAVFHEFSITGAEFAFRQRVEQRGVGDDQDGLVKCANQILAMSGIDGGLAAHRRIYLSQQCRWDLHIIEPPPHHGGGESGKIANHPAAEGDDQIVALYLCVENGLADPL